MSKLFSIIFSLTLALAVVPAAYANWTPPAGTAPACPAGSPGCDAPINVSINPQTKAGAFQIGPHPNLGSAILSVINDAVQSGSVAGQVQIKGASDQTKIVSLGLDTTSNYGWVQAFKSGSTAYPFAINPLGGRVGVNTKTPETTLHIAGTNANFGVGTRGTAGHLWTFTAWSGNTPTDSTQKGFYIVDQDAAQAGPGMGDRMIIDTQGNFKIGLWGNTRAAFELGGGVANKAKDANGEVVAGKLGYNLYQNQGDGVDILGGGTTVGDREVRIWDRLEICNSNGCTPVGGGGGTNYWGPTDANSGSIKNTNTTGRVQITGNGADAYKPATGAGLELAYVPNNSWSVIASINRTIGRYLATRYTALSHNFLTPPITDSAGLPAGRLVVDGNGVTIPDGSSLIIPTGAGANKVLTSDGLGRASWQPATGGSGLPNGTAANQTLRWNGTSWEASSNLTNDSANNSVGIGRMNLISGNNVVISGVSGGFGKILGTNGLLIDTGDNALNLMSEGQGIVNIFPTTGVTIKQGGLWLQSGGVKLQSISNQPESDAGYNRVLAMDSLGLVGWRDDDSLGGGSGSGTYVQGGHYGYGKIRSGSQCFNYVYPMRNNCVCDNGFSRVTTGQGTETLGGISYNYEYVACIKN